MPQLMHGTAGFHARTNTKLPGSTVRSKCTCWLHSGPSVLIYVVTSAEMACGEVPMVELLPRSLGGEAQAARERTAQAFQRYGTLSAATHRIEEQADEEHAKQVTYYCHETNPRRRHIYPRIPL